MWDIIKSVSYVYASRKEIQMANERINEGNTMNILIKRVLTITAVLGICIFAITIASYEAYAADEVASGTCGDELTWVLDNNGVLTISGNGYMDDYETASASPWYSYRSSIVKVVVDEGVTSIGDNAFNYCKQLKGVNIPDSVVSIGDEAFSNCTRLIDITIPDNVASIGAGAFCGCSSLTSITLPFVGESITATNLKALFGYVFEPSNYPHHYSGYEVPSSLRNVTITGGSIGKEAFYNCTELTNITILDNVTSIGDSAFYRCSSLTSITIPNSVMSIGNGAFSGCSGLTSITLPFVGESITATNLKALFGYIFGSSSYSGGVKTIQSTFNIGGATYYIPASLTSVTITEVDSIGNGAFSGCSGLTSVTVPSSVTSIGTGAFDGCSGLTSITIPDSVTSIGDNAFSGCSGLTSITIPDSVTSIGKEAFYNCSGLTGITIPDSVTCIQDLTFSGCSGLMSIMIPDSVTLIKDRAFRGCSGLTSIVIPDSVSDHLEEWVFEGCSGLTSITLPSVGKLGYLFGTSPYTGGVETVQFGETYYIPSGLRSVVITSADSNIVHSAFCGCSGLTSITIPDGVKFINDYAFYGCSGLTGITIPDSVSGIGNDAFYGCTGLVGITIPDSVTSIGVNAFSNCSSLARIAIPSSVTHIGGDAFSNCENVIFVVPDNSYALYFVKQKKYKYDLTSGHCIAVNESIEPDCTHPGNTGGSYCSTCGEVFSTSEILPALGHNWNTELAVDKAATCKEEGVESIHCARCGEIQEGSEHVIPATGHNYEGGVCTYCGDKTGWKKIDGYWYFFENDGTMATSTWKKDSKGWCYLGSDGRMVTNDWAPDSKGWCWIGENGYMVEKTKWIQYDGGWYYIEKGYRVQNSWRKDSKGWCYLGPEGRMVTNDWVKDSKGWCWIGSAGYMVEKTQWLKVGDDWYYIQKGYRIQSKWMKDSKGWCWLQSDGRMLTNGWAKDSKGWCWIADNGYMPEITDWVNYNGNTYYIIKGYRVDNKTIMIDGVKYIFDADGKLVS